MQINRLHFAGGTGTPFAIGSRSIFWRAAVSNAPDAQASPLAAAILRYLAAHPGAGDSAPGIADWWLPTMGVEASVEQVRGALEALEQAGHVEAMTLADGKQLWRSRNAVSDPVQAMPDDKKI